MSSKNNYFRLTVNDPRTGHTKLRNVWVFDDHDPDALADAYAGAVKARGRPNDCTKICLGRRIPTTRSTVFRGPWDGVDVVGEESEPTN